MGLHFLYYVGSQGSHSGICVAMNTHKDSEHLTNAYKFKVQSKNQLTNIKYVNLLPMIIRGIKR